MEAVRRPALDDTGQNLETKVLLHRLLYNHGLKNGTLMVLPMDQGLEHGPLSVVPNPPAANPTSPFRLDQEGNAIAIHPHVPERGS